MNYVPNMNRRSFLIAAAAAGGGFALGISAVRPGQRERADRSRPSSACGS